MLRLVILLLPLVAMWLLLVVPRRRYEQAHRALVASLHVGDDVVTTAGIYGTIVAIEGADGEIVRLHVADGVELRVARAAIGRRIEAPAPPSGGRTGGRGEHGEHDVP